MVTKYLIVEKGNFGTSNVKVVEIEKKEIVHALQALEGAKKTLQAILKS